jgi:D-aspartate ligase
MTTPVEPVADPPATPLFHPVLLGTDQGTYAMARTFHEQYGLTSTIVSRGLSGAISHSRILRMVHSGEGTGREELLSTLLAEGRRLRAQAPDVPLLLMCNSDSHVEMVARHVDELGEIFVFPRVSTDTLAQVADKTHFAQVCERLGLATPRASVVSFAEADDPGWTPAPVEVTYPVVAKPANSADLENLRFPGVQKVWALDTPQEWAEVVRVLREGGFRSDFIVQELIPGDDTHQYSVVAYRDRSGRTTAIATAQVLLGEHDPLTVGNPVAMITTPMPELMDAAEQILAELGWWGMANIDAKRDSRTGTLYFMEMNPRMGRNSFYATAAGADIAGAVVDDVVLGLERTPQRGLREVLYSIVSPLMIPYYVRDKALRRRVWQAARRAVVHPLIYSRDNPRRRGYVLMQRANHVRKFARYYPRVSESGF